MKIYSIIVLFILLLMLNTSCSSQKNILRVNKYVPDNMELYNTIVAMDSIFFKAYNTCDLAKQAFILSDTIEFYHDQGGLMTSKQEVMDGIEKNICGKVTRELIEGSIEVYPIKGYGAVQMGLHRFHNNQEPTDTPSKIGKFTTIWKQEGKNWKITRVISLH